MRFQFAAFSPVVGFVVMIDVAEEQTPGCPVDNQANIAADTNRPEISVFRLVEFMNTSS